jgi:hypothetical protein
MRLASAYASCEARLPCPGGWRKGGSCVPNSSPMFAEATGIIFLDKQRHSAAAALLPSPMGVGLGRNRERGDVCCACVVVALHRLTAMSRQCVLCNATTGGVAVSTGAL